ncbi:AcrVA2 family anti-CRISPR protein [Paraburkholderia adhaesiva]|uniref:AcrVA2 family anti-CRISPR protein n=1 Tax=Paraburkholderia adhaesiva TaxID=2883244 RepID=UPI001F4495C4|nr:hypothetical protein [Paraburkholderia adhaesiva]
MELNSPAFEVMRAVEKQFPHAWSQADSLRSTLTRGRYRDGSIFSRAEAETLSLKLEPGENPSLHPALLGALVAWRPTQGVYRFDQTFYEELIDTDLEGDVPSQLLTRLPGWAVFVETPLSDNMSYPLLGFWAYLSRLGTQDELELVGIWREESAKLQEAGINPSRDVLMYSLPLGNHPVQDLLQMMYQRADTEAGRLPRNLANSDAFVINTHVVSALLSLLLYLCSEKPDIQDWRPETPKFKFFGATKRVLNAKNPRQWNVGIRMGAALSLARREASAPDGTGSVAIAVRPHVRRAHWHSYWVGKRGEQSISLRWLPPIPVNVEQDTDLPVVIHQVASE